MPANMSPVNLIIWLVVILVVLVILFRYILPLLTGHA